MNTSQQRVIICPPEPSLGAVIITPLPRWEVSSIKGTQAKAAASVWWGKGDVLKDEPEVGNWQELERNAIFFKAL